MCQKNRVQIIEKNGFKMVLIKPMDKNIWILFAQFSIINQSKSLLDSPKIWNEIVECRNTANVPVTLIVIRKFHIRPSIISKFY